jgi:hypothetical protein
MEKVEFEQLISQLETDTSSVKYDFQIADIINKLLDANQGKFTIEQEQQLKWELFLFRFMTKNSFENEGLKTERFTPMMELTNGVIFPNMSLFSDEAFQYFETRASSTTNPILKARYLDFLWEKSKSKKKHLFALEAVEQYLLTLDEYDDEDAVMEKLDGLQRATELCLVLESKSEDKPLTEKVVSKLNTKIAKESGDKKYRWLIEMFELVLALSSFYTKSQISSFMRLCDEAAEQYHQENNFHIQRHFLALKSKLAKLLKPAGVKEEVDEAIGQSYLDEAEAKAGSGLVKVHFLQEAIEHYSKLGNKGKVEELTAEVKKATQDAFDNHEFKEFSSTVQLKKEDVERMKASLGTGEQVPESMGILSGTFFPNWNHAVQLTDKLSKKYVFQNLFPTVHYGQQYPVGRPQKPEEVQEDKVMQNFKMEAELALHWLTGFLDELIKEKKVTFDDFKKFFSKIDEIDHDTHETIIEGIKSYFEGDHFRACVILAPQLEDLMRSLLAVFGGQTTIPEDGAFREKTLGSILSELKPTISEPVYYYVSWVMQDYRGFNMRNEIAHGFFKKKHGTVIHSTALLHILCLLVANTHIAVKEKSDSE